MQGDASATAQNAAAVQGRLSCGTKQTQLRYRGQALPRRAGLPSNKERAVWRRLSYILHQLRELRVLLIKRLNVFVLRNFIDLNLLRLRVFVVCVLA